MNVKILEIRQLCGFFSRRNSAAPVGRGAPDGEEATQQAVETLGSKWVSLARNRTEDPDNKLQRKQSKSGRN